VKQASAKPDTVAAVAFEPTQEAGTVRGGAEAVIVGVESAAAGGKLSPTLAAKLAALEQDGVIVAPRLDVTKEAEADVHSYQTAVAQASGRA